MSDDRTIPNVNLNLHPISLSSLNGREWKLEINAEMYAIYPHPRMICNICEESKIGEICVDGFIKTKKKTKIPI